MEVFSALLALCGKGGGGGGGGGGGETLSVEPCNISGYMTYNHN